MLSEGEGGSCRLWYINPDGGELQGTIPWSNYLHAELLPRGQFRVHTPSRTYYLQDVAEDEGRAIRIRVRIGVGAKHPGGAGLPCAFEIKLGVQVPVVFRDLAGFTADGSTGNLARRRRTELKHGQVSMLATLGCIIPGFTGKLPGCLP